MRWRHSTLARPRSWAVVILGPAWMQRPFANRATDRLSELSYGVYLIHFVIVVYAIAYLGLPRDGTIGALVVWFAVIVPPALLYAAVTRRWFEIPARGWIEGACCGRALRRRRTFRRKPRRRRRRAPERAARDSCLPAAGRSGSRWTRSETPACTR